MLLLSHPTGNANVRQALTAFHERAMLAEFWTTVRWDPDWAVNAMLPANLAAELNRRSYPQLPGALVHAHPWREAARLLAARAGLKHITRHNDGFLSVAKVGCALDRAVANRLRRDDLQAVYAYEDGAHDTFREARRQGVATLYELPTAHWKYKRDLLLEEKELCPGWAETIHCGQDYGEKTDRKDEELELAEMIFVPSRYVFDTLPERLRTEARVCICSYGTPVAAAGIKRTQSSKLRVLYVGALTQGKGLAYLFRALESVAPLVEVTVIGRRVGPSAERDAALARYRYIPSLPHPQVLAEMERHDVLAFPTLTEGLALVTLEAMSRGMAVVTTPNSGTVGILRDGLDGFIVPIRSAEAVAEKLALLACDHALLRAMQESALRRAQECSWQRYRQLLAGTVQQFLARNRVPSHA